MNAIEQAIEALDFARSFEVPGSKDFVCYDEAIEALQSMQGEAVGKAYVDPHGNVTVSWFGEIKNGSLLYDHAAQLKVPDGWKFSRIGDDHIQIEHPDTSTICIADKGPINNMMFYELCLALLSAGKGE